MNMSLVHVSRVFHLFLISPIFIITETIPPGACSQAKREVQQKQQPCMLPDVELRSVVFSFLSTSCLRFTGKLSCIKMSSTIFLFILL